jgi:hypothetical protein
MLRVSESKSNCLVMYPLAPVATARMKSSQVAFPVVMVMGSDTGQKVSMQDSGSSGITVGTKTGLSKPATCA